ncbi:fatty-acid amide hydrolase 1-like [Monodon monoceros]|uniref:fatty-acid amide hydrolase 1-like n=1 Tax=Monodon monoceros TaxID=40151 RepID=UPI0010F79FF7|nr:fatty-acid amide hydrolase 1-like [Monodon monoceros]
MAHAAQALKVHQEVNCLTDVLGEWAGAHVTSLQGHDSTCGLVQFLEKPVAKGGVIVKGLKARVAIPFVKTNIPQTLLSSLQQAGRGRGWAQDEEAAESPDSGLRVRYSGVASAVEGRKSVTTAAGPVARDVKSLVLCLRALLIEDVHPLHPTVPPLPFREEGGGPFAEGGATLLEKVYICWGSDMRHGGNGEGAGGNLSPRRGAAGLGCKGDIVDPNMKDMVSQLCLPDPLKCFLAWILKYTEYQQEFIAKWMSLDLDMLLAPALETLPTISAILPWHQIIFWAYLDLPAGRSSYLALYNILNFPAGVVPVTTVMLQDEEELAFYRGYYRDRSEKDFQEVVRGSVGLSAAVQGTALPREEELCLQFMKEVEALVKKHRESK